VHGIGRGVRGAIEQINGAYGASSLMDPSVFGRRSLALQLIDYSTVADACSRVRQEAFLRVLEMAITCHMGKRTVF
jgi:hypothetical protein